MWYAVEAGWDGQSLWMTVNGDTTRIARTGEPARTRVTTAPRALPRPSALVSSGVTSCASTPSTPRLTAPVATSWRMTSTARLDGIAKPMPTLPPDGE